MGILVLTVAAIALIMLAMAIGVVLKRPCLRGSCRIAAMAIAFAARVHCGL